MLADAHYDLVILDEPTYMSVYHYLGTQEIVNAVEDRSAEQSAIVTRRGHHTLLLELADTVSEIRPVKHALDRGIQVQVGIDW